MRGAVFILICAFALTNGASLDVQDNRKAKISELLRNDDDSETEIVTPEENETEDENVPGNGDPSQAPAICADEESDEILVAHEICNKYYMCAFGLPVSMNCPPSLMFDYINGQCDWAENVDCAERIISYETDDEGSGEEDEIEDSEKLPNSDPSEAPALCASERSDGLLVANEICNRFYICSAGRPVSMNCPENLLYNYNIEQCDWPENVECGERIISYETEEEGSGEENEIEDIETIVNGTNSDPNEAPAICRAEESEGVLIAHEYCNYFYICSAFTPVSMACPPGLVYNWKKEQCDWPNNVECNDRVIHEEDDIPEVDGSGDEDESEFENDGGNNDHTQAEDICAAAGSDGILVASENCNQFYNCWNGKPVLQDCPANLYFNAAFNYCDWPQNVNCNEIA